MPGGGGDSQTIQKSDPWAGVQPYLLGDQTRRLKTGVTPLYSSPSSGTGQYPDVFGRDPNDFDWSGGSFQGNFLGNLQGGSGQMINPESDYETVGTPGIYSESQRLYQEALGKGYVGQTDEQKGINTQASEYYGHQGGLPTEMMKAAGELRAGDYDPVLGNIRDVSAGKVSPMRIAAERVSPGSVDLTGARAAQGALDPSQAMKGILSGQIDTQGLDALQQAATNRAMVGYGDAVTDAGRMFSEQIAPSIRGDAQIAGQYGGSRQGIAEGIAARGISDQLGRSARDLGLASMDVGTQLYGDASRRAQDQKYGMAGLLGNQAVDVATGNVNRDFTGQQFNASQALEAGRLNQAADLSGQQFNANQMLESQRLNQAADQARNIQEMASKSQQVGNLTTAANLGLQSVDTQGGIYDTLYGLAGRERADEIGAQQYPWEQLNRYASIITPGAGIGGTTTQTGDEGGGGFSMGGALGGGLAGAGIASSTGLLGAAGTAANPWAWPLIAGAGLLGGMR